MKQETDECARAVHNILRSHMAIQDDLFRPTWRKIIRIPGVYRPVPYGEKRDELRALAEQLHEIRTRIKGMKPEGDDEDGRFLISLRAYCTSLSESILADDVVADIEAKHSAIDELPDPSTGMLPIDPSDIRSADTHGADTHSADIHSAGSHGAGSASTGPAVTDTRR